MTKLVIKKNNTQITLMDEKDIEDALDSKSDTGHTHTKSEITDFPTLSTVATSGSYSDLSNKPTLSSLGGTVTVTKQDTAETGYAATYVVKQNGSQVGSKINIPKDFLVKSGSVKTVSTANNPVQGFAVGDKYLDFTVNTTDNSETGSHIYINVKDLVDAYSADNSTLELGNGNVFKVKDGGISLTKLSSSLQTTISGKEDTSNKVNTITSSSTTTQYPSAKAVYDLIGDAITYINQ